MNLSRRSFLATLTGAALAPAAVGRAIETTSKATPFVRDYADWRPEMGPYPRTYRLAGFYQGNPAWVMFSMVSKPSKDPKAVCADTTGEPLIHYIERTTVADLDWTREWERYHGKIVS